MRSKEQIYKRMNRERKKKFSLKRLKKPIKELDHPKRKSRNELFFFESKETITCEQLAILSLLKLNVGAQATSRTQSPC